MTKIPLFPLNMVVLPFEKVPLHIFEPRYKKMISESIENNSPFGIVLNNNEYGLLSANAVTRLRRRKPSPRVH